MPKEMKDPDELLSCGYQVTQGWGSFMQQLEWLSTR
jgi:hypothetical protein